MMCSPGTCLLNNVAEDLVKYYPSLGDTLRPEFGYKMWFSTPASAGHSVGFMADRLNYLRKNCAEKKGRPKHLISDDGDWAEADLGGYDGTKMLEMTNFMVANKTSPEIPNLMAATVVYRREIIKTESVNMDDVRDKFPRLFDTVGMISVDFNTVYPNLATKLYDLWPLGSKCIIEIAVAERKLHFHTLGIRKPMIEWDNDNYHFVSFFVLPYLLAHSIRKAKVTRIPQETSLLKRKSKPTEKGASYRVTIKGSREHGSDNLIAFLGRNGNVCTIRDTMPNRPPFIVAKGDLSQLDFVQYFVIVANQIIECENSFLQALDTCFKAYHVLNLAYLPETEAIWSFFEYGIFGRPYTCDTNIGHQVMAFIGQIIPYIRRSQLED